MKPTLFISDLHLEDAVPARSEWFGAFLSGPATRAGELYILGDLFEFWIGDDALSTTAQQVATALQALASAGVKCYFMHGNRDFLVGRDYAERAGLKLLPEEQVINLFGTPTLLLHGDSLCTDDVEYQALRRQVRDPQWQAGVLALSIEERLEMAKSARQASLQHTQSSSMEIMDVNAAAVDDAFRRHGVPRMIHGHTHRPARHAVILESGPAERIVLADWYDFGSYLMASPDGIESVRLES
ncbi:MAG: UDP-2,3-diacylglucosamine diphosphatase [Xanthomonadales bacterium]|nr:UDP-2,3-diacylglucosamine diphosphatase [Xanthomonadales bacterium]